MMDATHPCLNGLVTERDLDLAETEFPGISQLHAARGGRDRTFLDLLAAYLSTFADASARCC